MIIETEVEGRPAIVAFLNKDFEPVDEDDAEVIKIIFKDGEIRFAVPAKSDDTDTDDEED